MCKTFSTSTLYTNLFVIVLELASSMEDLRQVEGEGVEEEGEVEVVVAVLVVVLVETKGEPPVTTEGFSLRNNIGCLPRYHVVILSM